MIDSDEPKMEMKESDFEHRLNPTKKRLVEDRNPNPKLSKRQKPAKNEVAEAISSSAEEEPAKITIVGKDALQVLILVGLQGSGKSTFAARLEREGWATVSQDQKKKKRWKCETQAVALLRSGKSVVIDRCNFDEAQREHWIKIAQKLQCVVGCVVFALPIAVCIERVQDRKNHKTLPPGNRSVGIIRNTAKDFTAPRKSEGLMFCRTVRSNADIDRVFAEIVAGVSLRT